MYILHSMTTWSLAPQLGDEMFRAETRQRRVASVQQITGTVVSSYHRNIDIYDCESAPLRAGVGFSIRGRNRILRLSPKTERKVKTSFKAAVKKGAKVDAILREPSQ